MDSSPVPTHSALGDTLDWSEPSTDVKLLVELPFWLLTPNAQFCVTAGGCSFRVELRDDYAEFFVGRFTESRATACYVGPIPVPAPARASFEGRKGLTIRKSRTVLAIDSACSADVLRAWDETGRRARDARMYLLPFCAAHIPVVNEIVQTYRLATCDPHAHAVCPSDVAHWWILRKSSPPISLNLHHYADFDARPQEKNFRDGDNPEVPWRPIQLVETADFQTTLQNAVASPGEFELLDAMSALERGDYAGAIRRITTAIEVVVEASLREALAAKLPADQVERALAKTRNNFGRRVKEHGECTGRLFVQQANLERIRNLRHRIVHGGERVTFVDRHEAHRCVDTGRWIYQWFENRPERVAARNRTQVKRHLGSFFPIFFARITPAGVLVEKPSFIR